MLNFERDLYNTINRKYNRMKCYDSLYLSSNEKFDQLFSMFDFKDKDIFSIIGSGDQSFYFYNQGARQVDLYDINIVSIYYYYLRLWCIKYLGDLYPKISIDYVNKLLSKVKVNSSEEKNVYNFWKCFLNSIKYDYEFNTLFFLGNHPMLEKYITDVSNLDKILSSKDLNYIVMDIAHPVNVDKKYDVVYVSNISEYIKGGHSFYIYSDNLNRLLKDNGVVIGSNIMDYSPSDCEKRILSQNFIFDDIKMNNGKYNCGYCYTKRR